mgnify:CR=1 FL=1
MLSTDNIYPVTKRLKTETRKLQIIEAAMELLATTSVDALSTRAIAKHLGISQPALFRHFRSREAILSALVDKTRSDLGRLIEKVLRDQSDPRERLKKLFYVLLEHVEVNPGLPRILFWDALPEAGPVRIAIEHLLGMQRALVSALVDEGKELGLIRGDLDSGCAASAFVGIIRGHIFDWRLVGRPPGLKESGHGVLNLWFVGIAAGSNESVSVKPSSAKEDNQSQLVALDVRPIIKGGTDPLTIILDSLASLGSKALLTVVAPFRPSPLIALLEGRGMSVMVEEVPHEGWEVFIRTVNAPDIEDLRDFEAPEPLERVLVAAASLEKGDVFFGRTPRFPRLLLPHLTDRGLRSDVIELADGSALVRLEREE